MVFPGVRINTLAVFHNVGIIPVTRLDLDRGAVAAKLSVLRRRSGQTTSITGAVNAPTLLPGVLGTVRYSRAQAQSERYVQARYMVHG